MSRRSVDTSGPSPLQKNLKPNRTLEAVRKNCARNRGIEGFRPRHTYHIKKDWCNDTRQSDIGNKKNDNPNVASMFMINENDSSPDAYVLSKDGYASTPLTLTLNSKTLNPPNPKRMPQGLSSAVGAAYFEGQDSDRGLETYHYTSWGYEVPYTLGGPPSQ